MMSLIVAVGVLGTKVVLLVGHDGADDGRRAGRMVLGRFLAS